MHIDLLSACFLQCINHAAIDGIEFFNAFSQLACLVIDLFNNAHLLADALEVEVVGLINSRESAVEVRHLLAIVRQTSALFVHLLEGFGQGAELRNVLLCSLLHFG